MRSDSLSGIRWRPRSKASPMTSSVAREFTIEAAPLQEPKSKRKRTSIAPAPTVNASVAEVSEEVDADGLPSVVIAKAVRSFLKEDRNPPLRCSPGAVKQLNVEVRNLLHAAAGRAQSNGRLTVMAGDF